MKKITTFVVFAAMGLSLSVPAIAGPWTSFLSKSKFRLRTTPQIRVQPDSTAPSEETPRPTRLGLGRDGYTIGAVAIPYEGQQLGNLQCDQGEVAVGVAVGADTILRSVTGLFCKPINALSQYEAHQQAAPNTLGNPATPLTAQLAANGSALVGFEARYANTNEYDNRVANLKVLTPAMVSGTTGVVANESSNPGDDAGLATYGTFDAANSPWVRSMCPNKYVMTGVWVLYDSDSVKSVTPTCERVFAPGEAPSIVAEGGSGLGKGSEVGYLGGRTVSNAAVGSPLEYENSECPEGSVMTGWSLSSSNIGTYVNVGHINCQDINSITGSCTNDSPLSVENLLPYANDDLGREGCAMVGFQYKQQKLLTPVISGVARYSRDNQVISELHSTLANRDHTQIGPQGFNVGLGSNALWCWPHTTYNCNTTDWIDVRCPSGSFMVGVKRVEGPLGLTSLGAYCREAVEGPWTEATEPAPGSAVLELKPGALTTPIRPLNR